MKLEVYVMKLNVNVIGVNLIKTPKKKILLLLLF
jgi:hypothetical protein